MKKIFTLSLLLISSLLFANPYYSNGEVVLKNFPLSVDNTSKDCGGNKDAIDAYQDGVGVKILTSNNEQKIDNTPLNKLVFKYGKEAKDLNLNLKDYITNQPGISEKDIALANQIQAGAPTGPIIYKTCLDLLTNEPSTASGTYTIDLDSTGPLPEIQVYCDMDNGGWTQLGGFATWSAYNVGAATNPAPGRDYNGLYYATNNTYSLWVNQQDTIIQALAEQSNLVKFYSIYTAGPLTTFKNKNSNILFSIQNSTLSQTSLPISIDSFGGYNNWTSIGVTLTINGDFLKVPYLMYVQQTSYTTQGAPYLSFK